MARPRINPDRPLTNAEKKRRQYQAAKGGNPPKNRSPVADGRLRNLEYDVQLREAFYVAREPLAAALHQLADALCARLGEFVCQHGPAIATELRQPQRILTPLLRAEM